MVDKVYLEEDGWIPIKYTRMVELIAEGQELVLTSDNEMQLYYKPERKKEVKDERSDLHKKC